MPSDDQCEPGDVVQMAPHCTNRAFAGCFMIVEEVKDWGVTGYFLPVGEERDHPPASIIPYRAETGEFLRIGAAKWLPDDWTMTAEPLE